MDQTKQYKTSEEDIKSVTNYYGAQSILVVKMVLSIL